MNNRTDGGVILDGIFIPFTYNLFENGYEIIDETMAHVELGGNIRVLNLNMTIDDLSFDNINDLINYIYGFE